MKPKTRCEKWPVGCLFCDLIMCDGEKETAMNKVGVPGEVLTFEYLHKCEPCKPTQPECGECEFAKPQTNADRIRAMTDEELAETYAGGCPNGDRLNCGKYYLHGGRDCFNCWLEWLKSPVEEGEG